MPEAVHHDAMPLEVRVMAVMDVEQDFRPLRESDGRVCIHVGCFIIDMRRVERREVKVGAIVGQEGRGACEEGLAPGRVRADEEQVERAGACGCEGFQSAADVGSKETGSVMFRKSRDVAKRRESGDISQGQVFAGDSLGGKCAVVPRSMSQTAAAFETHSRARANQEVDGCSVQMRITLSGQRASRSASPLPRKKNS